MRRTVKHDSSKSKKNLKLLRLRRLRHQHLRRRNSSNGHHEAGVSREAEIENNAAAIVASVVNATSPRLRIC